MLEGRMNTHLYVLPKLLRPSFGIYLPATATYYSFIKIEKKYIK